MSEIDMKVFTLSATCKKCGTGFTYTRRKNLMGAERSVCDDCRENRNVNRRTSPRWARVVGES
jgi:hypothetical protein